MKPGIRHITLLVIACFVHSFLFAQDVGTSQFRYGEAERLYQSFEYDSAFTFYNSAAQKERELGSVDKNLIIRSLHGMAMSQLKMRKDGLYPSAHEYFKQAFALATETGNLSLAEQITHDWNDLYYHIKVRDIPLPGQFDQKNKIQMFFPVSKITSVEDTEIIAEISGGTNQGVYLGSRGGILTVHVKSDPERGNTPIGGVEVIEVYNNKSVVKFTPNNEMLQRGIQLKQGDNVQVWCYSKQDHYKGLLYDLAILNTFFNQNKYTGHYRYHQILSLENKEQEDMLIQVLLAQAHYTANSLLKKKDSSELLNKPLNNTRFDTLSLLQAMSSSNLADAKAFLRFVASFPAKYMGQDYKFDETFATWILNDLFPASEADKYLYTELNHTKEIDDWIKHNLIYIKEDTNLMNNWIWKLDDFYIAGNYDEGLELGRRLLKLAQALGRQDYEISILYEQGTNYYFQSEHSKALPFFDQIIKRDSTNANAYWQRANVLSQMESDNQAIRDYLVVTRYYPEHAGTHGSLGWLYFKSGRFKKAAPHVRKAYELDSITPAWSINLGHLNVVLEDGSRAMSLYKRALTNTSSIDAYKKGIVEDFKLFIDNGWSENEFVKLRDQVAKEYEEHYQYKIRAKELIGKGEEDYKKGRFTEAIVFYLESYQQQQKGRNIDYGQLRSAARSAGYIYFKLKEYKKAIVYYKEAWKVSRNKQKNMANQLADLEALTNLHGYIDYREEELMFTELKNAIQRKIDNHKVNKNLFLITVGQNTGGGRGYQLAENDAKLVSKTMSDNGELLFDTLKSFEFHGSNSSQKIIEGLAEVVSKASAKDVFMFYFAGNAEGRELKVGAEESLNIDDLSTFMLRCQAREQLIVLDAPKVDLAGSMTEGLKSRAGLSVMILEGGLSRIEMPGEKTGFLATTLAKALNTTGAKHPDGMISVKSLEHSIAKYYNREQLNISTYFSGVDFNISRNISDDEGDREAPHLEVAALEYHEDTRGGNVTRTNQRSAYIIGRALDLSGIKAISVDGIDVKVAKNGKFLLSSFVPSNPNLVVVRSEDKRGNIAVDTVLFTKDQRELGQTFTTGEGKNYALLIATDLYDNNYWSKLDNPINDAVRIGGLLEEDYGFEVEVVKNPSAKEMKAIVRKYMRKEYNPLDQLFVFVAGHGMYDPTDGAHVVCRDSKDQVADLDSYVPYWFFVNNLNAIEKCNNVFLSLDVCFGGGFFDQADVKSYRGSVSFIDPNDFIKRAKRKKTRLFLTSGGLEYVPDRSGAGHSPFALMFIEALGTNDGAKAYLTLSDILNYMGKLSTQPRYGKFGTNEAGGDFVFEYKGKPGMKRQNQSSASPN